MTAPTAVDFVWFLIESDIVEPVYDVLDAFSENKFPYHDVICWA